MIDSMIPTWDSKGHITVKKASSTVSMSTGPEQLRRRLTVMYNALAMIKFPWSVGGRLEPRLNLVLL